MRLGYRPELIVFFAEYRQVRDSLPVEIYAVNKGILPECLLDTGIDYLENHTVIFEFYLCLGRVDIHVHGIGIDLEIKHVRRRNSLRDKILISLHHRLVKIWAFEESSINEKILVAESLLCRIGTAHETIEFQDRGVGMDIHDLIGQARSQDILDSELQRLCRAQDKDIFSVVNQSECNVFTGQGDSCEFRDDVLELHIVGFEEFPPCRYVVKEISDGKVRPDRSCGLDGRKVTGIGEIHLAPDLILRTSCLQGYLSDGSNRCKRLSAKPEGQDIVQVLGRCKFRGRMSLETEHGLIGGHAGAVINHLDEGTSRILDDHGNLRRPGINGILHEFLHHGCRSLDDLPRSDHICYIGW